MMLSSELDEEAVNNFKDYLRIESVHPAVDYTGCVRWVRRQAERLGLPVAEVRLSSGVPLLLVSWEGAHPRLASLMLSSHMDVVPVYPHLWTHPPFAAEQDARGNIYARGAQDMKCVGVQYLEAVFRLIRRGFQPKRTVHICFTPDEEIGSLGMKDFVETELFKNLNVGCELDEGVASPDKTFNLYYGERTANRLTIVCPGTPGHGSLLHENTAGEKINVVIRRFMEKRSEEKKKLKDNPNLRLGDVTTINLTKLEGGVQTNVVPPELRVSFDCRLSLNTDHAAFDKWVESVCKEAGEGVRVVQTDKKKKIEPTHLNEQNLWWVTIKNEFDKMGLTVNTNIFPAATDARYLRGLGIPAFGFSPMNNTPVLLHDHDEYLNKDVFLKGIEIYENIISALASL